MRAGVLQLSRWGLLDRVVTAGTPPISRTVFHYPEEAITVSIRPSPGVDALYAPRRTILDRILVEAAEEAGAHVFHRTVVDSLIHQADGRVGGVVAVDAQGRRFRLDAAMTVGADGVRSAVAREADAVVLRSGTAASAVLYRYVPGLAAVGYEWAYGDRSAAGLLPTNAGETCVFVSAAPERVRRLRQVGVEHAFDTLLAAAAPEFLERLRDASAAGRIRGWRGVPGHVRKSWGRGWALVGDAGYYKDPITTHGMSDGLRDADLLSDAVIAALDGAPEAGVLAAYQETRDHLSMQLFTVTEEVARYDWDNGRLRGLLRRVSSAMSDEVDHLQALPERRPQRVPTPGTVGFLQADNVGRAG